MVCESKDRTRVPDVSLSQERANQKRGHAGFADGLRRLRRERNAPTIPRFIYCGGERRNSAVANLARRRVWRRLASRRHDGKKAERFDDFESAAEYLVASKYTNPRGFPIYGVSNGRIAGRCGADATPELFQAVVCGYPLEDHA